MNGLDGGDFKGNGLSIFRMFKERIEVVSSREVWFFFGSCNEEEYEVGKGKNKKKFRDYRYLVKSW